MKRTRKDEVEAPGQDSFLDVVANLVGMVIIVVMVVGAQTKRGVIARETEKQAAAASVASPDLSNKELTAAEAAATSVEQSIGELEQKIRRQNFEAALRQRERDEVQLLVTVAEQRLAEHRDKLGAAEQAKYDAQAELVAARGELARLSQDQTALSRPTPAVLQHLPTPMAKTVFGTEVHFRLLGGRLTYVPWDEMIAALKADAPNHIHKLRDAPRAEMSLPVIAGFGARYVLQRAETEVQTRIGVATQSKIELEKIYFVDAEANLGVPLADALKTGSQFRSQLAGQRPQQSTVTIWVYPDSFDQFRELKAELFKQGFLTAGRPLPAGHPIGGSPDGSRSSAE